MFLKAYLFPVPIKKRPGSPAYAFSLTRRLATTREKLSTIMKLTAIMLLLGCFCANARGISQTVTLSKDATSLKAIFHDIEAQTGYQFFFSDNDLKTAGKISIHVNKASLAEALQHCFTGSSLDYKIIGKTVVVRIKEQPEKTTGAQVFNYAYVKEIVINGTITNEDGLPLEGALVAVKGKSAKTTSDKSGAFTIRCALNDVLQISYIGYRSKEIPVINENNITVQLATMSKELEETVVVAYGKVKKNVYTGAAAQINSAVFENRPLDNVNNAIVGAAPGIQTTTSGGAPGSGPSIRLRGFGSYSASSAPLYVVDGAPYDGAISALNPADVASISVLKDASTSALYGSRAANGVIIITTKNGKSSKNKLSFRGSTGIVRRGLSEYDRVNAYDYYPLMWEAYKNSLVYGSAAIPSDDAAKLASGLYPRNTSGLQVYNGGAYSDISQLLVYNPFNVGSTSIVDVNGKMNPSAQLLYGDDLDWSKAAEQGGRSRQDYQMSFGGGGDNADYYGSFGYTSTKGYLIKSDMKRYNGRINVTARPTTWFKTGINMAGSVVKANQDNTGSNTGIVNPFYFSRYAAPIYPVYLHDATTGAYILDANGNKQYDIGNGRPYNAGRNAIQENLLNDRVSNRNLLNGRGFAEVSFLKNFKATVNMSVDLQNDLEQDYDNTIVGDGAPAGRAKRYTEKTLSYTFNQLVGYTNGWGKHHVDVLAGHETYDLTYNYLYGYKQGQIVDGITELPNFSTINSVTSQTDRKKIESYLSRASYDFDGKYALSASFRRDGNSKFAPDVRWANFWSVGGAWNITQERFMKPVTVLNQLKLRASYGKVGNDGGIDYYAYQAFYNLGRNNAAEPGFIQGTLSNYELTWESNNSLDIGVDFSLLNNRLSGSIDYFNRQSSGMIFSVPQPLSNGGTTSGGYTVNTNVGNMYNRGIEVQLVGQIVKTKDFSYTLTTNFTTFRNRITKMPDGQPNIINGTKQLSVGHSIYDFYLRHFYGVDQNTGEALYTALSYDPANPGTTRIIAKGDGTQDTVTSTIGNAKYSYVGASSIPKFYGSISNEFTYKNFTLSFLLTYQVGGKVFDGSYADLMSGGKYGTALSTDALRRWQKPGDVTDVPRMDNARMSDFGGTSDRWLTNGSYLNINNVMLSYRIPRKWLSRITARDASIYVSGENLHLFSARKGMNVMETFSGTTSNSYSYNRIMTVGLNLNF
ncbi:MAG: TonB-dependent receptor [Filimonas sp.]|nr:TonB-dependent receptor [Filimonas sp.]